MTAVKKITVIQDTREQLPLKFRRSSFVEGTVVRKLDTGDYSFECGGVDYSDKIAFERKSSMDAFGTLGRGHKRFKKELERALDFDYFCIIIENNFLAVRNKEFDNAHRTKMRGDVVIKILMALKFKYGIDVVFCNSPKEASAYIRSVFKAYLKHGTTTRDSEILESNQQLGNDK